MYEEGSFAASRRTLALSSRHKLHRRAERGVKRACIQPICRLRRSLSRSWQSGGTDVIRTAFSGKGKNTRAPPSPTTTSPSCGDRLILVRIVEKPQ